MNERGDMTKRVHAALEHDGRINLHRYPVDVGFHEGVITLDGEVEDVAMKKRACRIARRMDGVKECVDRLRVIPTEPERGDGEIRDVLCEALMMDTAFRDCTIQARVMEEFENWQEADREPSGLLQITVRDGIVTLEGHAPSPSHKYLVEAMAWWVRGCRDVINRLEVIPPRDETDDEITEALSLVLEKDPMIDASRIQVSAHDHVIVLEGVLNSELEKRVAEADAWCLSGVEDVVNKIQVQKT